MVRNISEFKTESQASGDSSDRRSVFSGCLRPGYTLGLLLLAICLPLSAVAQGFDHSHALFDQWLNQNVSGGLVDYQSNVDDSGVLEDYLDQLTEPTADEYESWTEAQQIAYWVNAYNAFTVATIIEHYPLSSGFNWRAAAFPNNSIWQISGVWKKIKHDTFDDQEVALNDIEHEILRKDFKEPRIHLALVCASIGCPTLRNEAFVAERLDEQFDAQAREYFSDETRGASITGDHRKIKVSKIFDWFGEDFESYADQGECFSKVRASKRGILNFIHSYLPTEKAEAICNDKVKLGFLDYDWNLNELPEGAKAIAERNELQPKRSAEAGGE